MIERRYALVFGVVLGSCVLLATGGCATSEPSAEPGINDRWMSIEIEPLVDSLESESREIYINRQLLAEVVDPRPGMVIADIGAGPAERLDPVAAECGLRRTAGGIHGHHERVR